MVRRTGGGSRRTAKKIASPIISPISGESSPIPLKFTKSFDFDFDSLTSSLKDKKKKTIVASSPLLRPTNVPTPDGTPVTIEGLRELVSSRTDTVKRSLDVCHSETLKEFESSTMRITKRFKVWSSFFSVHFWILIITAFNTLNFSVIVELELDSWIGNFYLRSYMILLLFLQ